MVDVSKDENKTTKLPQVAKKSNDTIGRYSYNYLITLINNILVLYTL